MERKKGRYSFLKNIILIVSSIVIILILAESANYYIVKSNDNYYVWPPNLKEIFMPNSTIFHGIEGESHFTINKLGYRGPLIKEKDEEYRILVVGGSTTECLYLDDTEAWPYLIMNNLSTTDDGREIIVMNIGKSGHNARDHIIALKYLIPQYEPDLIILLVGANDMLFKLSKRWIWKPFDAKNYDYNKVFYSNPRYSYKSSISYKIFRLSSGIFQREDKPQDKFGELLKEKREERRKSDSFIYSVTDLEPALQDYEKNINSLIEISSGNDVPIIFVTQPYLWKSNLAELEDSVLWMTTDFNGNFYPPQIMADSMDLFNKVLLDICKRNSDIKCIDLDKEVPKNLDYFYDDLHFNEKGSKFVAEHISSFIKENVLND